MLVCEFSEQMSKRLSFANIKMSKEPVIVLISDLRKLGNNTLPRARQRKLLDSIVFGLDPAPDPTLRLQFVDDF